MAKFYCKYCRKEYKDIIGAYNCKCNKGVKWKNKAGRNSKAPEKISIFNYRNI